LEEEEQEKQEKEHGSRGRRRKRRRKSDTPPGTGCAVQVSQRVHPNIVNIRKI